MHAALPAPFSVPTGVDPIVRVLTLGVVHDLRNLMFLITAHADMLAEHLDSDGEASGAAREDAAAIREASSRARALLCEALAAHREQAPQHGVDLNAIVRGMALLPKLAGQTVRLDLRLADDLWPVCAAPVHIEQVLMNLVINARDAMPDGGRLVVETFNRQEKEGGEVVLAVIDEGRGMDTGECRRLFEPFHSSRPGGTGVGLMTVRTIAALSGGRLEMSSRPGGGTRAQLTLPRVATGVRAA